MSYYKIIIFIFLCTQLLCTQWVFAFDPLAIYNEESRMEPYEVLDKSLQNLGTAVAGMVHVNKIENGQVSGTLFSKRVCSSVRFADQYAAPKCTGFLVRSNILITAAHCIKSELSCNENFRWVFGYAHWSPDQGPIRTRSENIYSCKRVIERKYSGFGAVDHAVIELDRHVLNITPLKYRTKTFLEDDAQLMMIGHPNGLPLKYVLNGNLLSNSSNQFFETDLDSFRGNSGSPILNQATGYVEGIMNRGHGDFVWNEDNTCKVYKVCKDGECNTSKGTRISNIEFLKTLPEIEN